MKTRIVYLSMHHGNTKKIASLASFIIVIDSFSLVAIKTLVRELHTTVEGMTDWYRLAARNRHPSISRMI